MTEDKSHARTSPHPKPLKFYHPASSKTGSAMQLEPKFSSNSSEHSNCFFMEMALQKTSAGRNDDGSTVHATFDWENKLAVKLGFFDICEILTVLEGLGDAAGKAGKGLYHQNGSASTIITCQKNKNGGYLFGLSRKTASSTDARRISIVLNEAEATGLRSVLQVSLFFLAFQPYLPACRAT